MTPEAAALRDVAIALGVDPSGDVLTVARQAAAAAREVDTAMLVLAAVDEPDEPLVPAIRRLLRERDEARPEVEAAERRGYNRAIWAVRCVLDGEAAEAGCVDAKSDAGRVLARVASLVDAEVGRAKCCMETEADAARLRAGIASASPAILAGIDALGSSPADVDARNAARDAVRALAGGGEAPAAVLTAAELEAVRGVLATVDHDVCTGLRSSSRALVDAWNSWLDAGRPLAGEESEG